MPASVRAKLTASITADAAGDFGGTRVDIPGFDFFWPSGTGANQIDVPFYDVRTLAGSANEDIDLQALTGADGASKSCAEVRMLMVYNPSTNGDAIHVKPSASNGWTALLADATDVAKIQPGTWFLFGCGADGKYPVSASDKSINVANQDGSAATYHILVAGPSA